MRNNASLVYNISLIIGDFFALVSAFVVAYILRVSLSDRAISAEVPAQTFLMIFLTLLPFWIFVFAILGLYNARVYDKRFSELGRILIGSFIGILFAISAGYIADVNIFPARLVTLYGFGLAALFVFTFRTVARAIRRELFAFGWGINNVLIVGDTKTTETLIESLARTDITGYKVLATVGGVKHPHGSKVVIKSYGNFAAAIHRLKGKPIHTIIQTELYPVVQDNDEILTYAQQHHIAYRFVPGNSELFFGNIEVDLFHSVPIIAVNQTPLVGWGQVVKRMFDVFASVVFLVVAAPIMLIIAALVKLGDGGPVLFRQERLSRFNDKVYIYKFRTNKIAYNGLHPEEAFAKMGRPELIKQYRANGDQLENDPRISTVGRFLRRSSLDELPQLYNVLRGDISLVGPRALVPFELEKYAQKSLILSVKSGLTGLAQISGVRDLSFEERRKLDLYYVQNWSFWNDLVIIFRTISVVLFHKGTRS